MAYVNLKMVTFQSIFDIVKAYNLKVMLTIEHVHSDSNGTQGKVANLDVAQPARRGEHPSAMEVCR